MINPLNSVNIAKCTMAVLTTLGLASCGAGTEDLSASISAAIEAQSETTDASVVQVESIEAVESVVESSTAVDASDTAEFDIASVDALTPIVDSESTDASGSSESSSTPDTNVPLEAAESSSEAEAETTSEPEAQTEATFEPETEIDPTSEPETETDPTSEPEPEPESETEPVTVSEPAQPMEPISSELLFDYESQLVPSYIIEDNTNGNVIDNATATLGRVLFYDVLLSSNDTVSCSSCHQQDVAFSDSDITSTGVNGTTGRHSMRLVNTRFAEESNFFWDERATSLEEQTTQPIRDHGEMGFSGDNGAPDFDALISKLSETNYYPTLFTMAFGNSLITETRMQDAMAQFIRSIQSFDSRYDTGRLQAGNNTSNFSNFTAIENEGKRLFMQAATFTDGTGQRAAGSGLSCNSCHNAPEFDIDENSRNNGVISVAGNLIDTDTTNTRSPTLRDVFADSGTENGPFMHDGSLATFDDVLNHYNDITVDTVVNPNLDNRLDGGVGRNNGPGQKLLLTELERTAITAFIKTLSGANVYTDERWADPFLSDGSLDLTQ